MNRSIDFSRGVRGKYAGTELEIVGEAKENPAENNFWAICIHHNSKLIERKIYLIQVKPSLEKVSVTDETGDEGIYPPDWFLPVAFDEKTVAILKELT